MGDFFSHPFVLGLLLGLLAALAVALSGWSQRRALKKELRQLQTHLHTQLNINAHGNQVLQTELDSLKKQNENLRISFATLQSRPDKAEQRAFYVYDRAIHLMSEKAPGFAPSWEAVLKEAEAELAQADSGLVAWVKKTIRPALGSGGASRRSLPPGDA
jgi:seryl-tRNA(Sec) selenium transferase